MQNIGFADAMAPAISELYPDTAGARAAERRLEFFNCHPYLAAEPGWPGRRGPAGGARRQRRGLGEASPAQRALGPPSRRWETASSWLALRPAAALAAAATVPLLGVGSVFIFLALYNAVHLGARCGSSR